MVDAVQTLPNTKNDMIVALVQKELIAKAKFMPFISNLSAFATKGTKSINVPKLSSFAVANRALGAAQDATALVDGTDSLLLDQNAYIAWVEDHRDIYQSTINYRMEAAKRAASAHAKFVDERILVSARAVAGLDLATGLDITNDDILALREFILKNDGELEKCSLWIAVDQETAMLKIDAFTRQDVYGQNNNIINGVIGRVYGMPVVVSNVCVDGEAFIVEKDGLGIAFAEGMQMSEQNANEYGAMSKRVAVDQMFGTAGLQLGEKGLGATLSPLVAKL